MEKSGGSMNPYYNQNYTRKQIEDVLSMIKECIDAGRFNIAMNENRQENIDFINEYNIYPRKRKEILMQISVDDFCHSLQNMKIGYEREVLYVFVPRIALANALGNQELVDIYTKFNVIKGKNGRRTIVISFHKLNKSISYLFR
ncbi:hypothetical protein HMPREF1584_00385 [Gardnerella vaginalis JCP8481A]|uniref:Uncharacterized protein n=2 Tax=Gardnerella vaginalis TaxID=2702 RepID=A0A133NT43_GARVA|nr:hypothetical protein HMPREF1585_00634 [Gardnerella vaginalis JCP8481B]EPI43985.1 hypothetical protein HMPREF1584_00385 [Gardnerella vaginalis JCP8481A]KXA19456.1 hypothetical protein HMPREF3208_01058 [Gardnerella vaginalis]